MGNEQGYGRTMQRGHPWAKGGMACLALLGAIVLGGCGITPRSDVQGESSPEPQVASPEPNLTNPQPTSPSSPSLKVVTTIAPMTQFTQAVAGDRAAVVQLIPSNVGIHDFQAKPRDVETIANADVLIQNGVGLETFLADLIRNAGNPDLTIVEAGEGIPTVSSPDQGEEPHAEGEQDPHNHNHGGANPHLWLDPLRAVSQVENIRQALVTADPQGKEIYEANAAAYIQALKDLDREIGARLSPYAGQTFVTFHDFAVYFAQRYGLEVEFLVEVPELSPSPQDLQRIINLIEAENIQALLTEPAAGKENLSALAQDLKLEISVFDPLESGDNTPETYFKIMRQNAENIANAMSPDS